MSEANRIEGEFIVSDVNKERLDKYLHTLFPDYSRTYLQELISNGRVLLNGSVTTKKTSVSSGDKLTVNWPEKVNFSIPQPEEFKFKILYEDNDMLIIDKPSGVVVHPAPGNYRGTVVNALLGRDSDFLEKMTEDESDENANCRPGIVHRLDKDTSGCLVIAKNPISKARLSDSFASREVKKTYKAIVIGKPKRQREKIETLMGRHHINRQKMCVVNRNGKEAVSIYTLVRSFIYRGETLSLLDVEILTGRTHQIRVHMAYSRLPILGDEVYGGNQKVDAPRQMLHAWKLDIPHPADGRIISVESPLPDDFNQILLES